MNPDRKPPPLFGSSTGGSPTPVRAIAIGGAVMLLGGGAAVAFSQAPPELSTKPTAEAAAAAPTTRTPKDVPVPGAMKAVPAGAFVMGGEGGDPDELPAREVTVDAFEIDETEVTVRAYAACVKAGACTEPDRRGACTWGRDDRADHPVNCVDHTQAAAYCKHVGRRLPREEEWEYAARGPGDGGRFPWKAGDPAAQLCWNGEGNDLGRGKRVGTCPVGSYPAGASPFGAVDMAGNVWEWTDAPYCPYGKPDCGSDPRVIRGGAWNNLVPGYVRAKDRSRESVTVRNDNIGFRCAK